MDSNDTKPNATPTPADPPHEQTTPQNVTQIVITTGTLWRAVAVVLVTLAGLWALHQARTLTTMLVVSIFFALALIPGVEHLHKKRGWRRGSAVGVIYLVGIGALLLLVVLLIPAIATLADQISKNGSGWMTSLDDWTAHNFGVHIVDKQAYKDGVVTVGEFLKQFSDKLLPAAGQALKGGVSLVFNLLTIAMFTFYFTADFPRLERWYLSLYRPSVQQRLGWTIDQSVADVGGYFYSRLLLTLINGTGFFVVMIAVGVPVGLAIPLAVFGGFVSEFIPSVGTYIGAAVPVLLTLALQGLVPALIVVGYAVVYQQIENYWLSPRISAKTMELNGGLAFAAALAGGAIFGPMGAFMALPVAALIVAFVTHYRHGREVVYESGYWEDGAKDADGKKSAQKGSPPKAATGGP
jgi:predicted PurR-regulated permease PerM